MGTPLVNNPLQIPPAAPLNILGTPAPANYEAQIFYYVLAQPNVRQNVPDLCDVRQLSECFSKLAQWFVWWLTNKWDTDWRALLYCPQALHIVWQWHPVDSDAPRPNYCIPYWYYPHINGVDFAELNSYEIGGLSSAILRCLPLDSIHYIFGATGEGWCELHENSTHALHYSNNIFFQSEEDVLGSCRIHLMRTRLTFSCVVIIRQCQLDRLHHRSWDTDT